MTKKEKVIEILKSISAENTETKAFDLPEDFCALLKKHERKLNRTKRSCLVDKEYELLLFWPLDNNNEDKIVKDVCWSATVENKSYQKLYLTSQWGATDGGRESRGSLQLFCKLIKKYERIIGKPLLSEEVWNFLTTPDEKKKQ